MATERRVRGLLFVDYVRMIRGCKSVDWSGYLTDEDDAYLTEPVDPKAWYPMAAFERMGLGIVQEIARGDLLAVRMWGRLQFDGAQTVLPALGSDACPIKALHRFQTLRGAFFDFDAVQVIDAQESRATIQVDYGMCPKAEEAACNQTLGFFERLLETTTVTGLDGSLRHRSWAGAPYTTIELRWKPPRAAS